MWRWGRGRPIVFIGDLRHGAFSFRYLLGPLAKKFSITLADPLSPGLGEGEVVSGIEDLALLVERRVGNLAADGAIWVAHGESALAALWLGLNGRVTQRALVAISPFRVRRSLLGLAARLRSREKKRDQVAEKLFEDPTASAAAMLDYTDPAVFSRQEIRWLASRHVLMPAAKAIASLLIDLSGKAFAESCRQFLSSLSGGTGAYPCPLKLVCGAKSERQVTDFSRTLQRSLAGAELYLPECGPVVQVENPAALIEVIEACAAG